MIHALQAGAVIPPPPNWRILVAALGRQMYAARTLAGWSQVELAALAGTSQGAVSRLESGRCSQVPLVSVLKLLHALAAVVPQLEGAVAPTARALLACVGELATPARPLDPGLAALLRAYHALPPGRRQTFLRLVLPIAAILDDRAHGTDDAT
jgi:transcriptional regulator with XRE-family HTH domain